MRERRYEPEPRYDRIVYAIAMLLVGSLSGYIIGAQNGRSGNTPSPPPRNSVPVAPVVDDTELRTYRDILARDPSNVQAAIKAGNLLYDAQRYNEAIPLYQQAFALSSSDINVSTDLGTALWYSARADEALAQYERSLAINATHAQTLFNVGIVKSEGKRDYPGAIAVWERLLASNPSYPDVQKVRSLIDDARQKSSAMRPRSSRQ